MDNKPTLIQLLFSGFTLQVVAAIFLCTVVVCYWFGDDTISQDGPQFVAFLHLCAAFLTAKVGWIIYWWRRSPR